MRFDNRFTRELPADPLDEVAPRQVLGACYSRVRPIQTAAPRRLGHAAEVAELLQLDEAFCQSEDFARIMTGNLLLPDMDPHAMCYGGHQFGHWAGQLGDGRAINLGEVSDSAGGLQMLQLKGAGPTPYSRRADGLAVLRSSLREYLCSEAMHHLGVPTTRALSLCLTGDLVVRDMFYDGRPEEELGAITSRVAPSFLRFGNFEILAATGQVDLLRELTDFCIRHHFQELLPADGKPQRETYLDFYAEVLARTAEMVLHWQRVGFVHGVMNTDNMSILGLTIDYGPYGWLEGYDPSWTPNTTDAQHRRYRYGQQAQVAQWNLMQLANALVPLVGEPGPLQERLDAYAARYEQGWLEMMRSKLGLEDGEAEDGELFQQLVQNLQLVETDMTIFFTALTDAEQPDLSVLAPALYQPEDLGDDQSAQWQAWFDRYRARRDRDASTPAQRRARMAQANPRYVFRNYMAQEVIDELAQGRTALLEELHQVLRQPYTLQPGKERFAQRRPEWARQRPGCSMLSCSS